MIVVAGFGFGCISGAFSLVNVLADMTGPGTIGLYGHSDMFFITSGMDKSVSLALTYAYSSRKTDWKMKQTELGAVR